MKKINVNFNKNTNIANILFNLKNFDLIEIINVFKSSKLVFRFAKEEYFENIINELKSIEENISTDLDSVIISNKDLYKKLEIINKYKVNSLFVFEPTNNLAIKTYLNDKNYYDGINLFNDNLGKYFLEINSFENEVHLLIDIKKIDNAEKVLEELKKTVK